MKLPAQTRLSVRLTVSQTAGAGAGEIECLIIVICRRLAANLEGEKKKKKKKRKRRRHQESVNICLVGTEHRGGCVLPTAAAADTKSHSLTHNHGKCQDQAWGHPSELCGYKRRVKFHPQRGEGGSDEPTGRTGGCWDCLLLSCNWINLPSNLFRPVTLLHSHEGNLRSP